MSFLIWALCLAGFGAVWVFTGSGWALALLIVSALALPLSAIPAALAAKRLRVTLSAPDTAGKGTRLALRLRVDNPTLLPFARVRAEAHVRNKLTRETVSVPFLLAVPARSGAEAEAELLCEHCGALAITPGSITARDALGFLALRLTPFEPGETTVAPETFEIRLNLPLSADSDLDADQYSPDRPGTDYAEVFQVRDYAEGDSPKQIHWKLSTKFDRLISRDPGLPLDRRALVLWERSRGGRDETPAETDAMAETAVTLCRELLRQAIGCRVVWNDDDGVSLFDLELREEADLYSMLPKLLSAAQTGGETAVERFLQQFGPERCSRTVFIGAHVPPRLPELGAGGLTSLLCSEDAPEAGRTWRFTPETAAEALQELDLY